MLTLNDGRNELWQWDTGRKLTVDADCSQVHFSNKVFGRSIDVDVVDGTVAIPDVLLQVDNELIAWAFVGTPENGYTKISKVFKVNKRNKPADYVFTPPEQTTLGQIMKRLDRIEESQDPDAIKNAVDDYLANNQIQIDEKDPTVPAWAKQETKPKYTAKEVGAVASSELSGEVNDALAKAKASGEFDGKSAYEYAREGGYAGTEAEFAAKLAQELPTTLPNPCALNIQYGSTLPFTKYDGSETKSIRIPVVPTALPNPRTLTINGVSYDGSETVNIDIEGGSGASSAYLVLIEGDDESGYRIAGAVKGDAAEPIACTVEDVYRWLFSGDTVLCVYNDMAMPLIGASPSSMGLIFGMTVVDDGSIASYVIRLSSDGAVNVQMSQYELGGGTVEIPEKLPNPNALTIGDVTYDGSATVDMTAKINALIDTKLGDNPGGGGGGESNFEELFRLTTTEEVGTIETGIDLNAYKEIVAYCMTVPVEGTSANTHFDWYLSRKSASRINSTLHSTQKRTFFAHVTRLGENRLHAYIGYGGTVEDLFATDLNESSLNNWLTLTTLNGIVVNGNVNENFKFGSYGGNTMLKIGTQAIVYGRK